MTESGQLKNITLSIVSHGHGKMVEALLQDLKMQSCASQIHVVLTQNIPEPDPALGMGGAPSLEIVRNDFPRGFSENHNAALRGAATPWVLIVNPDIRIPDPSMIERLIAHPSTAGLIAPIIRNSSGACEDFVRRNLDPLTLLLRRLGLEKRDLSLDNCKDRFFWIAGMFLALPLDAWQSVDGFDERFFLYCEDYDLCARLRLIRRELVIDRSAEAIHDAQRTSHRSLKYLRWHLSSLFKVWVSPQFWRIWVADRFPALGQRQTPS